MGMGKDGKKLGKNGKEGGGWDGLAVGEMRAGCASGFEGTVADGSKYQTEPQISGQVGFDTPYPPLLSPEFNMSKIIHLIQNGC
jgi:hypothetical protein